MHIAPDGHRGADRPELDPPRRSSFRATCSVFGKVSAMAIWVELYNTLGDVPTDGDGLGLRQPRLRRALTPTNYTLYVALGPVGSLAVEVNHAGTGQKDEAITIAKAILAKLGRRCGLPPACPPGWSGPL